jgi:hypothetical protein
MRTVFEPWRTYGMIILLVLGWSARVAAAQVELAVTGTPPILYPETFSAGTYAPVTIGNQRIMLLNTASARGTNGLGRILVSIGAGTFSIPYRSASYPAERGTCNYAVMGGSSAQVTTLTTSGALAGLQRSLTLTFDSTNAGTYVSTATKGGSLVDGGSGYFYEVMPIQSKLDGGERQSVLTWSGGVPPFWVETTTNLAGTNAWTNLSDHSVVFLDSWSELPSRTNGASFFRVRGQ